MNSDDGRTIAVGGLEAHPDLPAWAKTILKNGISGDDYHVSEQVLDTSYLEFLNEQIALNARGDEWSGRLRGRIDSLSALIGLPYWLITVSDAQYGRVAAYVDVKNRRVLHMEIDNL